MKVATVMVLCPRIAHDATQYTYIWAQKAIKMAKSLGYNVVTIAENAVTYNNVTDAIIRYRPEFLASFSHGCPTSFNGQHECVITRRYSVNELMSMDENRLDSLFHPVKIGAKCGKNICVLQDEICLPLCANPTNVRLLKKTITLGVACHAASQLGRCAIVSGCPAFVGYDDLLVFPTDDMRSQDIFGEINIQLMKNILMGQSVGEAYNNIMDLEDSLIREFKTVKWLGLPLLWNHLHRELLGDPNVTIYSGK